MSRRIRALVGAMESLKYNAPMVKKHARPDVDLPYPPFLAGDDKRTVILRAAHTLFLRDGFSATSMDAVTREAKVSKATVYSHFESKEMLFEGLIRLGSEHGLALFPPLVRGGDDPMSELLAFFEPLLAMIFREGYAWNRMVIAEAPRHPQNAKLFYESVVEKIIANLTEYLAALAKEGKFSSKDVRIAAEALMDMVAHGPVHRALMLGPEAVDYRKTLRYGIDLLLKSGSSPKYSASKVKDRTTEQR